MIKKGKNGKNIKREGPQLVENYSNDVESEGKRNKQQLKRLVISSM